MWPKKPKKDMWSNGPAMLIQHKMLQKPKDDKNCQDTESHKKQNKCEYKDSKSQSPVKYVCPGKNCQEKENNNMWSVTNTDVQLPKPVIRRLHKDKTCQSTRCYRCPVKPMYSYDKNCQ